MQADGHCSSPPVSLDKCRALRLPREGTEGRVQERDMEGDMGENPVKLLRCQKERHKPPPSLDEFFSVVLLASCVAD